MTIRAVPISEAAIVNPRFSASTANGCKTVAFLPMAGLSELGFIVSAEERNISEVSQGYTYFEEGDVLLAKITPCLENGKAAVVQNLPHRIGFGSTEYHVLRPKHGVDARFLFYMIWNPLFRHEASRNMTGSAGQKRVPADFVSNYKIPLPPLPEQRRIADILDKADAIRRKREQGIRLTEELLRSTFLEMFGDPARNPKGWPVNSMNRISRITGGYAFKSEWFAEVGARVIRISDIGDGKVNLSNAVCVDCEKYSISTAYQCLTDDILMALSGATTGKLGVVTDTESSSFVNQRIAIIRANNCSASPWLTQLLSNKLILASLLESAGGSAQANLSTKSLESLVVPVPPDDMLFQYAEVVKTSRQAQSRRQIALQDADNLFNSLVQRAFRGEL